MSDKRLMTCRYGRNTVAVEISHGRVCGDVDESANVVGTLFIRIGARCGMA